MHELSGKVVIISGAAKGQGRSHALTCTQAGAAVVRGEIDLAGVKTVAGQLRDEGYRATATSLDVSAPADWDAAVGVAMSEYGHLDSLVNNAGIESTGMCS